MAEGLQGHTHGRFAGLTREDRLLAPVGSDAGRQHRGPWETSASGQVNRRLLTIGDGATWGGGIPCRHHTPPRAAWHVRALLPAAQLRNLPKATRLFTRFEPVFAPLGVKLGLQTNPQEGKVKQCQAPLCGNSGAIITRERRKDASAPRDGRAKKTAISPRKSHKKWQDQRPANQGPGPENPQGDAGPTQDTCASDRDVQANRASGLRGRQGRR